MMTGSNHSVVWLRIGPVGLRRLLPSSNRKLGCSGNRWRGGGDVWRVTRCRRNTWCGLFLNRLYRGCHGCGVGCVAVGRSSTRGIEAGGGGVHVGCGVGLTAFDGAVHAGVVVGDAGLGGVHVGRWRRGVGCICCGMGFGGKSNEALPS